MLIWLKAWGAHMLGVLIVLERLYERLEPVWNGVERRLHQRRNTMGSILQYLSAAKYIIPVVDAVIADIEKDLPTEKADVVLAVTDFKKAFGDAKTAFENLVTAVKGAIANS